MDILEAEFVILDIQNIRVPFTTNPSHTPRRAVSGQPVIVKERLFFVTAEAVARAKTHHSLCVTLHILPNFESDKIGRRTQRRVIRGDGRIPG